MGPGLLWPHPSRCAASGAPKAQTPFVGGQAQERDRAPLAGTERKLHHSALTRSTASPQCARGWA